MPPASGSLLRLSTSSSKATRSVPRNPVPIPQSPLRTLQQPKSAAGSHRPAPTSSNSCLSSGPLVWLRGRRKLWAGRKRGMSCGGKGESGCIVGEGEKLEKARKQALIYSQSVKSAAEKYTQAVLDYNTSLSYYEGCRKSSKVCTRARKAGFTS